MLRQLLSPSKLGRRPSRLSLTRRGRAPPICHSCRRNQRRHHSRQAHNAANSVEIARFGLLSAFSLPFVTWIAAFSYDYAYRGRICQEALGRVDEDLLDARGRGRGDGGPGEFLGRDKELAEVSSLLDEEPSQIIVIAGSNEAGKSSFVRELLKGTRDRGVTMVQLAQRVDGVNSFMNVFVDRFDLRWLRLRHQIVDVLPFAGSEILVMKEQFSDRDMVQALEVVTQALTRMAKESGPNAPRPVIVIDGLGEGTRRWMEDKAGQAFAQRLMQWSIHITKERRLAHIVMTGSEQIVIHLTDMNRVTRGHVRVVGLGDLSLEDAAKIVRNKLPDATDEEVKLITGTFGGFVHDVKGASRDIQARIANEGRKAAKVGSNKRRKIVEKVIEARFQQQVERVAAAFADARDVTDSDNDDVPDSNGDEEMDPYLDSLKDSYSALQASSKPCNDKEANERASWTQLELWQTLRRIVSSPDMAVSFSELRDNVYRGDKGPILELMSEDVLSFAVNRSSDGGWFWKVTPASPALGFAFVHLVENSALRENFQQMQAAEKRTSEKKRLESKRVRLHKERKNLDIRKRSLMQTIELGKQIGKGDFAHRQLNVAFEDIVREEVLQGEEDCSLRNKLSLLEDEDRKNFEDASVEAGIISGEQSLAHQKSTAPLQSLLKSAVLEIASAGVRPGGERFSGFKEAFDQLARTRNGGVSPEGVVRVIKTYTGQDVSLASAEELVKDWDRNNDENLDFGEFLQLLLSDDDRKGNKTTIDGRKIRVNR